MVNILMASSANLFGFEQIEPNSSVYATLIFEEINEELGEYLLEKSTCTDSTMKICFFVIYH